MYNYNVYHLNSTAKQYQTNSDTPHDERRNQFAEQIIFRFQVYNNMSQVLIYVADIFLLQSEQFKTISLL